ncbi:MAG: hypothetical protein F4W95_02190 [Chloroflexi bacterium]|nr:hypothetical protein [Chloroflexota bacterium]MYD47275.1 hypothetical protein [Chloroflexota bacterium]
MTQLRSLLERINAGAGPSLGFGAIQSARLPAMALIARCSGDLEAALLAAGDAADAVVIAAPGGSPGGLPDLGDRVWGAGGVPLTPENVALWHAAGADFMVSPPTGAEVDAVNVAQPGMTHGMRIPDDPDDAAWRVLSTAPVDFLVLDKSAMTGTWTFADLAQVADAVSRTDKFQIVRLGLRPSVNELVALHQAGAVAVVAEANDFGSDGMAGLKADLTTLPRVQPTGRRRVQPSLETPTT